MAVLATIGDLKTHLNISSTADDGELTLMLDAAEDVVRSLIGSQFPGASVTERVTSVGGTVILAGRPVDDVQLNGGAVDGFTVNRAAGLLYDVPYTVGPLTATYTTGGGGIPASITLATLIIAAHLHETQRMPGLSRDSAPAGFGGADGVPDMGDVGRGFAIPRRAEELLRPHMRGSVIA